VEEVATELTLITVRSSYLRAINSDTKLIGRIKKARKPKKMPVRAPLKPKYPLVITGEAVKSTSKAKLT